MEMVALTVVLEKLVTLIADEAQLLGRVPKDLSSLRDDLESMKSFLQDVETRSVSGQGVRTLVKQVRDVVYDTENVLEEYIICFSLPPGHGFLHSLHRGYHYLQKLRTRHRLAVQVQHIKEKVKSISERRRAFSFPREEEATGSNTNLQVWHDPRIASLFIDECDLIGIEKPRSVLISWLVGGEHNLTTISVVGMGGVGKTTLAKKVYDSQAVKKHFHCRAWITVSKSYTPVELLRALLKDFLEEAQGPIPEGLHTASELQLVNKLKNYLLKKRFVVVFDDVWNIKAWKVIKSALPECCCGSRIIFTTRIGEVVESVELTSHVYYLDPLPEEEAWTLFSMNAFRGVNRGICPKELMEMSQTILKKCGGLPLAIVAIASLLSRKEKHILEWKKVHDSLAAEMQSNSNLEDLEKILLLSYKDLPYVLKCCFLYLSVFPEDYLIKRMKIIRLWVVEGLVEGKPGLTLEEVAEDYLNELVSRNMIQVVRMDPFNRVTTCRVHDIMREIIQLKSRDESFVMILNDGKLSTNDKIRIMAVHGNSEDLSSTLRHPSLRSLLLFASVKLKKAVFKDLKFLRVLELEGAPLDRFPPAISDMVLLRYLSLRSTMLRKLPESIGKLTNLEILDLKFSPISSLPDGILKLKNLSQLRGYDYLYESLILIPGYNYEPPILTPVIHGISVPAGVGRLTNLQKLGNIEVNGNGKIVRDFGCLTQLRRLGILGLTQENGTDLCNSLEKLKHLTALYMVSLSTSEPLHLDSLSSHPQFLQRLYVKSSLASLPKWIMSLEYLGRLVLQYSNLENDPLRALQNLPNLVVLELREAYAGEELSCDVGGYPRLKNLALKQLWQLKSVKLAKGAMTALRGLGIASCGKLETVPSGIEDLRDLQHLWFWDMPAKLYFKLEPPHGEDFWKVQHIRSIQVL